MVSASQLNQMTNMVISFLKMEIVPGLSLLLLCMLVFTSGVALWLVFFFSERMGN